jgi:hypothetical protein
MAYGARRRRPLGVPVDLGRLLPDLFLTRSLAGITAGPDVVERRRVDEPRSGPVPLQLLTVPEFQAPKTGSPQVGVGR